MLSLEVARIRDYYMILKLLKKHNRKSFEYYSNFNDNIFSYFITKNIYKIKRRERVVGLIICNFIKREVYFVPTVNIKIDFNDIYKLLVSNFKGYDFPFVYYGFDLINSLGIENQLAIIKNYKIMVNNISNLNFINSNIENLSVERMKITEQESLRVELQNKIFGNLINRKVLTVSEVIAEEKKKEFLKDLCFFLKYQDKYIGYGQIVINNEGYFLINFGILEEFRGKGYAKLFLSEILKNAKNYGVETLYLKVDNYNLKAIKLYEDLGFEELINVATIKIF
ncbi:putative N-acetyltransferase YycN [Caloramator mitchellensis]|uniref:Putative N-acetyltransferase YycN n=1 Tax=Caloramator mitchellensis TaxID=908809 RepID=A0A0R3JTZ9_CALMK|nr:GNAT family N-acetyltransferase [Caloramator mitchellensis]KRQ87030.1 putative N-acetyltransferase YycN [Caloramator mitchellensis]